MFCFCGLSLSVCLSLSIDWRQRDSLTSCGADSMEQHFVHPKGVCPAGRTRQGHCLEEMRARRVEFGAGRQTR